MIIRKFPDQYQYLDKTTIKTNFNVFGEQKSSDSAPYSDFYRTDIGTLQQLTNDVTNLSFQYKFDNQNIYVFNGNKYRTFNIPSNSIYSNINITINIDDLLGLTQANTVITPDVKDDALYIYFNFEDSDYASQKNINIFITINKGLDDNNFKGYTILTNLPQQKECKQLIPTTNEALSYQNPTSTANKFVINFQYSPSTNWNIVSQIADVKEMFGDYSYRVMNNLNSISMLDFLVRHWFCIQKTSNRTFNGVNYGATSSDSLLTAFYPDRYNEPESINYTYQNLTGDGTQSGNRNPMPVYSNLGWAPKSYARQSQTGDNLLSSLSTQDLIKQTEVIHYTCDTLDYFMKDGVYQPRTEYGLSICGFLNNIPNIPSNTPKTIYITQSTTFKSRYPTATIPLKWFDYSKTTMATFKTSSIPMFQTTMQNQGSSNPAAPVYTTLNIMYGFTLTKDASGAVGTATPFNRGYLGATQALEFYRLSRSLDEFNLVKQQINSEALEEHKKTLNDLMNKMDDDLILLKKQSRSNKNIGIITDKGDMIADCKIVNSRGEPISILYGLNIPEQTINLGKITNSNIKMLLDYVNTF